MNAIELFLEASEAEQSFLAHALYEGMQSGAIKQTDEVTPELYDRINLEQAFQNHKDNTLKLRKTVLYAVKVNNQTFAMYFAEHEGQVQALHAKNYRQKADKVINMETRMDASFYNPANKKHQTWRAYRNRLSEFPAYVGEFEKG